MFLCKRVLSIFIVIERIGAGVSSILLTGRLQPYKTNQDCHPNRVTPLVIALITIVITPTFLQPTLATADTNFPLTNSTIMMTIIANTTLSLLFRQINQSVV